MIDNKLRQETIQRYISTPKGRQMLAASMQQPLRLRRDYAAVGRKTCLVEQLPDGAQATYDKDADVAAYVVGEEGESIQSVVKPRRIHVPLFEIATNPTIPFTQIRERRYDVLDRMQTLAKSSIMAQEDNRVFAVIDACSTSGFDGIGGQVNPDIPVVAPISAAALADAFALIEQHDLKVARVFMNARDFADFRKFGRETYGFETQEKLLETGFVATIYGAQLITSRLVPQGTVYLVTEADMLGRIPVRVELTVMSADKPEERKIGFSIFEQLGIGVFNPYGVARLTITR